MESWMEQDRETIPPYTPEKKFEIFSMQIILNLNVFSRVRYLEDLLSTTPRGSPGQSLFDFEANCSGR